MEWIGLPASPEQIDIPVYLCHPVKSIKKCISLGAFILWFKCQIKPLTGFTPWTGTAQKRGFCDAHKLHREWTARPHKRVRWQCIMTLMWFSSARFLVRWICTDRWRTRRIYPQTTSYTERRNACISVCAYHRRNLSRWRINVHFGTWVCKFIRLKSLLISLLSRRNA